MSSPSYTSSAQEIDPAVQSPAREQHSNLELKNLAKMKKKTASNWLKFSTLKLLKKSKECNK